MLSDAVVEHHAETDDGDRAVARSNDRSPGARRRESVRSRYGAERRAIAIVAVSTAGRQRQGAPVAPLRRPRHASYVGRTVMPGWVTLSIICPGQEA